MGKKLLWGTAVYVGSIAFFLGFMFHVQNTLGNTPHIYLLASLILLIFAVMFGYIFISTLLASKKRLDENLSHLTREIVHELNIPLSTIQANVSMLKRKAQDDKSIQRLTRIEDASKRLERLYRELVYSIKKEFQPVEKEVFDVKTVIEERAAVFEAFDRNALVLQLQNYTFNADKIGFEKMIDNLLMNAMKYSPKESPVTVTLENGMLSIRDEGAGMDETQLLRIYERYYQADSTKEGQGIGLALVKSYCDNAHIDIQIRSQKGVGTTVTLLLPKRA